MRIFGLLFAAPKRFKNAMPTVLTLDKSISVLETIVRSPEGIGTRAIAQELDINVATAHNIATTFAARGLTLPRDAALQVEAGTEVPLQDARPGDLLFFRGETGWGQRFREGVLDLVDGAITGSRNMISIGVATAAAGIIVMLVLLLALNSVAIYLRERASRRVRW